MIAILTNSPAAAEIIARIVGASHKRHGYYEGDEYCVTWTTERAIELAPHSSYGYSKIPTDALPLIPVPFKLIVRQYRSAKGVATDPAAIKQLRIIDEVFSRSQSIIAATDASGEGELAFRWIYAYLGCTKPYRRLWLSSLTDDAVREGLTHLHDSSDFDALYAAADCRAKADWLVGVNVSQAIANVSGLGYNTPGRIGLPTLAMICTRYRENAGFTPAVCWQLGITLRSGDRLRKFRLIDRIGRRKTAETYYKRITACGKARIIVADRRKSYQAPPFPYNLAEIQKAASSHFGYSPEQTLTAAYALYERQLITYPGTDCRYISEAMFATVPELLSRIFRQEEFSTYRSHIEPKRLVRRCVSDGKVIGHHALLPTGEIPPLDISNIELTIYRMIVMRTIEAFAPRCEKEVSLIEATVDGLTLRSRVLRVVRPGWRAVCRHEEDREEEETDDNSIVQFMQGETIEIDGSNLGKGHTAPSPLYTEETLLAAMESAGRDDGAGRKAPETAGIGTPENCAAIISELFKREYIERSGKSIIPTERGLYLYDAVRGMQIADLALTEGWEKAIAQVERREMTVDGFMQSIAIFTRQVTEEIAVFRFSPADTQFVCPKCGEGRMILRRRVVKCSNVRCGLVLFREVAGKILTDAQVEELLTAGKTEVIQGFRNKAGRKFDAVLTFDDQYQVKFAFPMPPDK